MNFYDIDTVKQLCDGPPTDRENLLSKDIRRANIDAINHALNLLQLSYTLLLLEGKIHCDEFHRGKNSFSDLGERYGYINSFVRVDSGTNTFRFAYRRPTSSGKLFRKSIPMKNKGYTRESFRPAAHEYEIELCLMTEEHYSLLRDTGKTIKEAMRKLRKKEMQKFYKR